MGREPIWGIPHDHRARGPDEDTVRRNRATPSPSNANAGLNLKAPLTPAGVVQLQAVVGNRATQALLVQRTLSTQSSALEGFATGGAPGTSSFGKVLGALSGSSFNSIRDALARYEKAKTPTAK